MNLALHPQMISKTQEMKQHFGLKFKAAMKHSHLSDNCKPTEINHDLTPA